VQRFVQRDVRSEDPGLSPEANRLLTEELREILGADRVEVAADAPPPVTHPGATVLLAGNRPLLVVMFLAGVVVGAIVGLATGSWWALVVAVVLDACATAIVAFGAILLATEVEHVSPGRAVRLEREGVRDPDEKLTELLARYAGARPLP